MFFVAGRIKLSVSLLGTSDTQAWGPRQLQTYVSSTLGEGFPQRRVLAFHVLRNEMRERNRVAGSCLDILEGPRY